MLDLIKSNCAWYIITLAAVIRLYSPRRINSFGSIDGLATILHLAMRFKSIPIYSKRFTGTLQLYLATSLYINILLGRQSNIRFRNYLNLTFTDNLDTAALLLIANHNLILTIIQPHQNLFILLS